MSSTPRGYAVIANMSRVSGQEDRNGSEADVANLQVTWSKLGYDVIVWENRSAHVRFD